MKYHKGRMHSHLKLFQIREQVKEVRAKGDVNARRRRNKNTAETFEQMPVDDQMGLPIGTDFDFIIKKKAEEIDSQKQHNNVKMDDLVDKLGYMDYRDALACNKYIIEAKRSGRYHQVARARILEAAFSKMNVQKRAQIQKNSQSKAKTTGEDSDQISLDMIMNENPEMAEMYQQAFAQEKMDREIDLQRVEGVHEYFDDIQDQRKMANKHHDPRYDVVGTVKDTDDEAFSTDLEADVDPLDTELYRHYKLMQVRNKMSKKEYDLKFKQL